MRGSFPCRLVTRRRVTFLTLVLALRALVPIGFMPVTDRSGIHLGFCPGEAQPPGALGVPAAGHLAHHHQHGTADHGSPGSASHPPCLFALSGSPAFAPDSPAVASLPPGVAALCAEFSSRLSVPAIVRAQTPRAPPSLA